MRVLIICICLSVPTNNETVNLVLLQNTSLMRNIQYDSVWKLFYYNKSESWGSVDKIVCASNVCA